MERDRLDPGPPLALNICKWAHAIVVMPFATDLAHDAVSLDMVEVMPGREALSRNRRRSSGRMRQEALRCMDDVMSRGGSRWKE